MVLNIMDSSGYALAGTLSRIASLRDIELCPGPIDSGDAREIDLPTINFRIVRGYGFLRGSDVAEAG